MEILNRQKLKEIFRTDHGCVYQCDKQRCFFVEFAGSITAFKFPCFLSLKKLIDRIDVDAMAINPSKASDLEIISPCGCERCYVLTLPDIIQFRELLAGAKVMLQLNSILHERLYRVAV